MNRLLSNNKYLKRIVLALLIAAPVLVALGLAFAIYVGGR